MLAYNGKSLPLANRVRDYNALYNAFLKHNNAATKEALLAFWDMKKALIEITSQAKQFDLGWFMTAQHTIKGELDYIENIAAHFHKNGKQIEGMAEVIPERQLVVVDTDTQVVEYKGIAGVAKSAHTALSNTLFFKAVCAPVHYPVLFYYTNICKYEERNLEKWHARVDTALSKMDTYIDIGAEIEKLPPPKNSDDEEALALLKEAAPHFKRDLDNTEALALINESTLLLRPKP